MDERDAIKYLIIGFFVLIGLLALLAFLGRSITIPYVGEITVFTALIIVAFIIALSVLVAMVIKLIEVVSSFFQ